MSLRENLLLYFVYFILIMSGRSYADMCYTVESRLKLIIDKVSTIL